MRRRTNNDSHFDIKNVFACRICRHSMIQYINFHQTIVLFCSVFFFYLWWHRFEICARDKISVYFPLSPSPFSLHPHITVIFYSSFVHAPSVTELLNCETFQSVTTLCWFAVLSPPTIDMLLLLRLVVVIFNIWASIEVEKLFSPCESTIFYYVVRVVQCIFAKRPFLFPALGRSFIFLVLSYSITYKYRVFACVHFVFFPHKILW